jgi:hypothetical protein
MLSYTQHKTNDFRQENNKYILIMSDFYMTNMHGWNYVNYK